MILKEFSTSEKIEYISSAIELVKNILEREVEKLPDNVRVEVTNPSVINSYIPTHPIGGLAVVFQETARRPSKSQNSLIQDRDITIAVISVINTNVSGWKAHQYCDFIADALAGFELESLKRVERKITCGRDNHIDEEGQRVTLGTEVIVPAVFVEKKYRS